LKGFAFVKVSGRGQIRVPNDVLIDQFREPAERFKVSFAAGKVGK
jgi:hypothetical protein